MKLNRTRLMAGVAFALLSAGLVPATTHGGLGGDCLLLGYAQAQSGNQRVVMGAVVDADSAAVPSATVFLKNLKSKSIRSFTTTDKGRFQFAQVSMTDDYDLWAEKNGRKTAVKTVSSWDARKEFEVELKMK